MSTTTTFGFISDTFPNGLRVLVIDDDSTFLLLLEKMLKTCHYEVTKCHRAMDALCILRKDRTKFDLVIININMPDMDGFRLLEIISIDMDLPVVVTSSDDKKDVVMKVIIQGACDFLVKPIRLEMIQLLWQHVVRKREVQHDKMKNNQLDKHNFASLRNKENRISSNGGKDCEVKEGVDKIGCISTKKSRMIWTDELRKQFATIVNQIGIKNAVPKKILELMNVPGLTRENVASHLQKHRLQLQKENENKQKGAKYTSLDQLHNCDMNPKRKFSTNYNLQLPATTSPLSKSLTREVIHIGRPSENFNNGITLHSSTYNREVSLVATPTHPAQNFGDTNVQVNGVVSDIQPLQTSNAMSSFENSFYKNLYEIQDGLSNTPIVQQPNKLQRLNAGGRGQGDGMASHNVYEHAFSFGTNPNASVRSNKNEAFFSNSSSGYEFGQDNFAIKPADKHYAGSAELMAAFGGYAAGNNFM